MGGGNEKNKKEAMKLERKILEYSLAFFGLSIILTAVLVMNPQKDYPKDFIKSEVVINISDDLIQNTTIVPNFLRFKSENTIENETIFKISNKGLKPKNIYIKLLNPDYNSSSFLENISVNLFLNPYKYETARKKYLDNKRELLALDLSLDEMKIKKTPITYKENPLDPGEDLIFRITFKNSKQRLGAYLNSDIKIITETIY